MQKRHASFSVSFLAVLLVAISVFVSSPDMISGVMLIPPAQYVPHSQQGGYVPTDTELLFQVNLTTTYGTRYYGDLRYTWTFGEGAVIDTPTATHTYLQPGDFPFSVLITNSVSSPISSSLTLTAVGCKLMAVITHVHVAI